MLINFRDLQVPVQQTHPSECSTPGENKRTIKQVVKEGFKGLHQRGQMKKFAERDEKDPLRKHRRGQPSCVGRVGRPNEERNVARDRN